MRILLLNTSERSGGAAVAANRLMHALEKEGCNVKYLVRDKQTENPNVISINHSWIKRKINHLRFIWERLVIYLLTGFNKNILFQLSIANTGTDVSKFEEVKNADIIHLHWINQGFLSIDDIRRISQLGKPVIWTIHDQWIANSIYHYTGESKKREKPFWFEKYVLKKKEKIDFSIFTIVGCSKWISEYAKDSKLLLKARITSIPNPINLSVFKPQEKELSRQHFNLDNKKDIILFGAAKLTDTRKGLSFFLEACTILLKRNPRLSNSCQIALLGKTDQGLCEMFPITTHSLGFMSNESEIIAAYSAADLFIIPSLEDNLPNTIMESMACGTPCVGFKTGGIPEMIDHKVNGYLAEYKSAEDLANGIEWVLNHTDKSSLSKACISKVTTKYTESVVAQQYIELYKNRLKNK